MIAGHNLISVFVSCKLHDDNFYNAVYWSKLTFHMMICSY